MRTCVVQNRNACTPTSVTNAFLKNLHPSKQYEYMTKNPKPSPHFFCFRALFTGERSLEGIWKCISRQCSQGKTVLSPIFWNTSASIPWFWSGDSIFRTRLQLQRDKCRSKPLGISCVAWYMYGLLEALPRLTPKWASCIHNRSWPLTYGLVLQQFDLDVYCFVGKETVLLGPGLFSCAFSFLICFILFCLVLSLFSLPVSFSRPS